MLANPIIDVDLTQEDGQGEKEYPSYDTITLRHLATFTDGYGTSVPNGPKPGMYYPFDPEPPRFSPPGSKYAYNSSPQVLAYCMTKLIYNRFSQPPHSWPKDKCNLDHFFERFVATKIGMARDSWRWSNEFPNPGQHMIDLSNPEGLDIRPISQSMFMSAAAMARWGHLFLNRGNWNGEQIISRAYVDEATTFRSPKRSNRKTARRLSQSAGTIWIHVVDQRRGRMDGGGPETATGAQVAGCAGAHRSDNGRLRCPRFADQLLHGDPYALYAASGKEVPANMVVVRLAFGVAPDGRRARQADSRPMSTAVSSRCSVQRCSQRLQVLNEQSG